jgi:REP element-mobilizing transposase RayT
MSDAIHLLISEPEKSNRSKVMHAIKQQSSVR